MARRMFETFGPRLGITEDENDTRARKRGRRSTVRQGRRGEGARHPRDGRGGRPRRHPHDRPPVPLRPGAQSRHSGGVPGPRLPDPLGALDPEGPRVPRPLLQRRARQGDHQEPLELNHVWPENYSVNSAQKVWAASFAAHHPNVVVLDLSSFKCGHDAPTYGLIDSIIETSKTPYAALHDIDANKPSGSIKIRVKTYAHALKLHEERLQDAQAQGRALATRSTASGSSSSSFGGAAAARASRTRPSSAARGAARKGRWPTRRPCVPPSPSFHRRGVIQLGKKTADEGASSPNPPKPPPLASPRL
jgi:hypothetical protein